jgi:hypothetical protein
VVLLALGLALDPRRVAAAVLVAWLYGLGLALGALLINMTMHAARARWFVVLRRPVEAISGTLPLLAVIAVPLFLTGLRTLYPWTHPHTLDLHLRHAVEGKQGWLEPRFFLARTAVYLVAFVVVDGLLRRWSRRMDHAPRPALMARQRALSAGGLPALVLLATFASFDWMMSLEPDFYSTVYGLYVLSAFFVAALAALIVVAEQLVTAGVLPPEVSASHFHALSKLQLTSVPLWAWQAFSQLLLIWIADLPDEVGFYLLRTHGGWAGLGLVLIVGMFVLPLGALLSRAVTRVRSRLRWVSGWLLVMVYLDLYWLVMPPLLGPRLRPSWLDAAALLAVLGAAVAWAVWRFDRSAAVPRNDPLLAESLRYRTS